MAGASNIGKLQIEHTSKRTRAAHYRTMALALQAGTVERYTFPKAIPRGKPVDWYLAQAERLEQQSQTAGELAHALVDLEHQHWLDRITPELAAEILERHLAFLDYMVPSWLEEWPMLVAKLSTDQREAYAQQIRDHMTRLVRALRGRRHD